MDLTAHRPFLRAAMGKKGKLKSALSGQQARLKKKADAVQAAQVAEQRSKKPAQNKGKGRATANTGAASATVPFSPTDLILLVGEGNFSFARALVCDPPESLEFLPANNVVATAYDSEAECFEKYPEAAAIVDELRVKGADVIFGVDGTKLEKQAALKGRLFDKIVFNFPHAGKGISDQDRNILSNQMLLLGFLRSAAQLLRKGPVPSVGATKRHRGAASDDEDGPGEGAARLDAAGPVSCRGSILITLRNVPPYTLWDLPKLAKNPSPPPTVGGPVSPRFIQLRSFAFVRALWKGYEHRMTKGERAHGTGTTGQGGEDRTWEFYVTNRDRMQ